MELKLKAFYHNSFAVLNKPLKGTICDSPEERYLLPELVRALKLQRDNPSISVLGLVTQSPVINWLQAVDIPFIFLTASAQKNEVVKGKELGVSEYLTKPFKIEVLIAV